MYLKTEGDRLWQSLMDMAQIGKTPKGGVCRVAFSDEDRRGRDTFTAWAQAANCDVRVDQFGNMFARRQGKHAERPVVMIGSHLDSQPTGGKFDGVYGVLAGLEVVRTLNDNRIETEAPIEVAVWTNEEGCIFKPMLGSAVFAGMIPLQDALTMVEPGEGWTLKEGLERIGYAGDMPVNDYPVGCYFEAHIEQGPVMEANNTVVGVVTSSQGQRWYNVTLVGEEAHAGPTPMHVRKDAMVGAARIIQAIDRIGRGQPDARSTVGRIQGYPNSPNTIAGRVEFSSDLRHPSGEVLRDMDETFRQEAEAIADELGLHLSIQETTYIEPIPFHPTLVDLVRRMAIAEGEPYQDIYTGAGHDACNMAKHFPTTMIFVPCENGISHNEVENAKPEHLAAGCNVLANAVLAVANGEIAL